MTLTYTIILISSLAFTIFIAINPISLGIIILLIALLLSIIFAYSISSWLAFLIFLIYIGGILVIFSYFVAIVPNQTLAIKDIITTIIISILSLLVINQAINIHTPIFSTSTTQLNILYIKSNALTLIILACVLLFTIIVVVKLTSLSKGPLRPFSY